LDAVRIALGNTGSKTTIHRLMKELEAEEDSATALSGEAVSDALQTLVGQLAAQLHQEAEATVAAGQTRAEAQVVAAQGEVITLTQQAREASDQIQRLQITLADTHQTLTTTEQVLRERDTTIVGLHERLAGLERQLAEREAHLASIETKHVQARDALDHFRQASKEQREIDARQHEQAVQALQVELRRATDSIATKSQELLALNRDNARLTEQAGQQNKDLREGRRALQAARERATEADAMRQRTQSLEQRMSQMTANLETMRGEHSTARAQWDAERIALSEALRDAKAQGDRWGTIESMLSSLQPRPGAVPDVSPST
jgi:chromosome segregation ATPase